MPELLAGQVQRKLGAVPSRVHGDISGAFKELRKLPKDDDRLRAKAGAGSCVPDPNRAGDLKKLRGRAWPPACEQDRESALRRPKVFRREAVRVAFRKAWQERDYPTILAVARKIPENALQENPRLLMWYELALTRSGEDG
ncbi:MAG: hypothetical protein KatS3mg119_2347 [Rhodothalassiaceae bacterium]|nr:MAG: hypothetical protein KatS3mg119_2347 [Rhodothalassiaceae bacterium]